MAHSLITLLYSWKSLRWGHKLSREPVLPLGWSKSAEPRKSDPWVVIWVAEKFLNSSIEGRWAETTTSVAELLLSLFLKAKSSFLCSISSLTSVRQPFRLPQFSDWETCHSVALPASSFPSHRRYNLKFINDWKTFREAQLWVESHPFLPVPCLNGSNESTVYWECALLSEWVLTSLALMGIKLP